MNTNPAPAPRPEPQGRLWLAPGGVWLEPGAAPGAMVCLAEFDPPLADLSEVERWLAEREWAA